jgi:hypothetical protein
VSADLLAALRAQAARLTGMFRGIGPSITVGAFSLPTEVDGHRVAHHAPGARVRPGHCPNRTERAAGVIDTCEASHVSRRTLCGTGAMGQVPNSS